MTEEFSVTKDSTELPEPPGFCARILCLPRFLFHVLLFISYNIVYQGLRCLGSFIHRQCFALSLDGKVLAHNEFVEYLTINERRERYQHICKQFDNDSDDEDS